jgi:hypothetical protein
MRTYSALPRLLLEDFKAWRERMGLPSSAAMQYLKENPNYNESNVPVE